MVITSDRGHLEQSQLRAWGWHLTPFSCNVVVWTSRPRVRPVQRVGVWSVHPCQIPTGEPSVSAGGLPAVANVLLCWGSQHTTHMASYDTNTVFEMSTTRLVHTALQRFKALAARGVQDSDVPTEVFMTIEDELIPLLEQLDDWEPSDEQMLASFGTPWHDGL